MSYDLNRAIPAALASSGALVRPQACVDLGWATLPARLRPLQAKPQPEPAGAAAKRSQARGYICWITELENFAAPIHLEAH